MLFVGIVASLMWTYDYNDSACCWDTEIRWTLVGSLRADAKGSDCLKRGSQYWIKGHILENSLELTTIWMEINTSMSCKYICSKSVICHFVFYCVLRLQAKSWFIFSIVYNTLRMIYFKKLIQLGGRGALYVYCSGNKYSVRWCVSVSHYMHDMDEITTATSRL